VAHRIAAAIAADVFTHQKDALVAPERVAKRRAHRLAVGHLDCLGPCYLLLHDTSLARRHRAVRINEAAQLLDGLPCPSLGKRYGCLDLGIDLGRYAWDLVRIM
jgi:hypothetical protein